MFVFLPWIMGKRRKKAKKKDKKNKKKEAETPAAEVPAVAAESIRSACSCVALYDSLQNSQDDLHHAAPEETAL